MARIVQRDSLNNLSRDETPYTAVYDAADRLTGLTLNPGTGAQASYTLTYDANGNLARKQNTGNPSDITTFQWDSRNRLTGMSGPGVVATFAYDIAGRRVRKTVNGQTTLYLYDGAQAVGEIRSGEVAVNLTGLGLDEALATYTRNVAGSGERTDVYLTDLLGSVVAQTGTDQTVQGRSVYSAYGQAATTGAGNPDAPQYTGREDDKTGLYFYRARYYDPVLKRFIQSDPIGLNGGINTYAYVNGNPASYVDPDGHFAHIAIGGVIGGISGLIGALNNPCATTGSLLQGAAVGFAIGAVSAAVPIGGTIFAAAARNALAGGVGNAAGQLIGGGPFTGRQVVAQSVVGAISGGVGNLAAMNTGIGLISETSLGVGTTAAIATGAALNLGMPADAGGLRLTGSRKSGCTCGG